MPKRKRESSIPKNEAIPPEANLILSDFKTFLNNISCDQESYLVNFVQYDNVKNHWYLKTNISYWTKYKFISPNFIHEHMKNI